MSRRHRYSICLALMIAAPAAAQERSFEVGAFGKLALFDGSLGYDPSLGVGARAGYYFARNWMIEVDGAWVSASGGTFGDATYAPFHVRVIRTKPQTKPAALYFGAGYAHTEWSDGLSGGEDGVGALAGFRYHLRDAWALRLDVTADFLPDPVNGAGDNWNWGVQLGVSFLTGR